MCAGCHGAPGQKPEAVGLGLNPPPPDLAKVAAQSTPAELFWVTKYGIKMTGMPAWGATHEDQSIWPVVAFLTQLTTLDAEAYQAFLASAAGKGHHADQANHGEHAHDAPSNDRLGMHEGGKMDSQPLTENQATAERGHSDDGHDHEH